jgi:hypothetical protein
MAAGNGDERRANGREWRRMGEANDLEWRRKSDHPMYRKRASSAVESL